MAIYTTDKSQTYSVRKGFGMHSAPITDYTIVAFTTAMLDNANDEVALLWVPKNAVILGCTLRVTDMDTGAALLFDLGDDALETRLIAASSGQAAGAFATLGVTGFLYKYTADTLIKLYVNTAAATGAAGTVYFSIDYIIDEGFSTTALVAA